MIAPGRWRIGLSLVLLATVVRLVWALCSTTIPVGDFATYRESAMQLGELGHLDHGFIYMPGWVVLLAGLHLLGGGGGGQAARRGVWRVGLRPAVRDRRPAVRRTRRRADAVVAGGDGVRAGGAGDGPFYALWPAGDRAGQRRGDGHPGGGDDAAGCGHAGGVGTIAAVARVRRVRVVMGLAAYLRAVALPLTALSAVYWVVRRAGARATVARTAVAIALTVTVLLPSAAAEPARERRVLPHRQSRRHHRLDGQRSQHRGDATRGR